MMPVYYCPKCRGYVYIQDGRCPIDGFDLAEFYGEAESTSSSRIEKAIDIQGENVKEAEG